MRILFITRRFPPSVGGMQLFAYDLVATLKNRAEVDLVKWGGSTQLLLPIALLYLWAKAFIAGVKNNPDVICVQDGLQAPIGYLFSKLFNKPYSVQLHGLDITYDKWLYQNMVTWAVRRADAVFCISRQTLNEAKQRGVKEPKLHFIPLAVKDEIYNPASRQEARDLLNIPPSSPVLLSVGRLVKRKGLPWFVSSVMPSLVQRYPSLVLLIVGDGNEKPNIVSLVKSHGLEGNVRLLGQVSDETRQAAYNASDIFVMPNVRVPDDMEGFGLVLLEASLCCLPLVSSAIDGITDAVTDGKNGVLLESEDAEKYRRTILQFLGDPSHARKFGLMSREFTLNNYTWERVGDHYMEVLEGLKK